MAINGEDPKSMARDWTNRWWMRVLLVAGGLAVLGVLIWQGVTAAGNPDPTVAGTSSPVAVFDIAALVFREGLECVLVLSAITAGLLGSQQSYRKPIGAGAAVGMVATLITWFIAVRIVDDLTGSFSALAIQAATGLLAIVVLLIVMNWFFHKIYWTGWISFQNRRKKGLISSAGDPDASKRRLLLGLGLLGLASVYREGFEVVLFLQSYRLRMGNEIILYGALIGLFLSGVVALLTFAGHKHLPYKRMLIITGVLLAMVLFVMVGEEIFEMQQAGWIGAHQVGWLSWIPDWAGVWFSIFPNWETLGAQVLGVGFVLGCYFLAKYQAVLLPKRRGLKPFAMRERPPEADVTPLPPLLTDGAHD